MRVASSLLALIALTGCSSIVEGTTQNLLVNTNPAGASCAVMREGVNIGTVPNTPGTVMVKKTKHDITVVCAMSGYQQATYINKSGAAGATFGNIILGGGIGWAVDSATGADNKYDSHMNITMVPAIPPVALAPMPYPYQPYPYQPYPPAGATLPAPAVSSVARRKGAEELY